MGQGAQGLGCRRALQGVEQREAILADRLGIRCTLDRLLWQTAVFDAFAIALVPGEGGHVLKPGWGDGCELIQGCAQGLGHEF